MAYHVKYIEIYPNKEINFVGGEKMDYKYFIVEITTSNRLVFRENATTAVNN